MSSTAWQASGFADGNAFSPEAPELDQTSAGHRLRNAQSILSLQYVKLAW